MRPAVLLFTVPMLIATGCKPVGPLPQETVTDAHALFLQADETLDRVRTNPKDAAQLIGEVLARLEVAVSKQPDDAWLQLALGRALITRDCTQGGAGCSARAKTHLNNALALSPNMVRARVLLAHEALNSGCTSCAQPHVIIASSIDATNPYVLEVRGRYAESLQQLEEAERYYTKAIESFGLIGKHCPSALLWLSEVYKQRDDFDRAEVALKQAADCAPDGAWSVGNLGTFYIYARGDYGRAIPILHRALSIAEYGNARRGLALALYERWADAYLTDPRSSTLNALWREAQTENPNAVEMFFVSATFSGTGRAARALLESGLVPPALLDQVWQQDKTPLQMAVDNDNTELAVYLIQRGAHTRVANEYGEYPVHVAAAYGNLRILQALSRAKADMQAISESTKSTALIRAASAGTSRPHRLDAARFLVERGVPVGARSADGWSALGAAITAGDTAMTRLLLSLGANPNGREAGDLAPAAVAIQSNELQVLRELVAHKAKVDIQINGMPAVQYADETGKAEIAKYLRTLP